VNAVGASGFIMGITMGYFLIAAGSFNAGGTLSRRGH